MKKQLKAIFDSISQESVATPVKVEPAFEVKRNSRYGKDASYNRGQSSSSFGGGRGRGKFNRGVQQNTNLRNISNDIRKTNLLNSYGNISRCGICQSTFHLAKECPHTDCSKSNENKASFFTQEVQKYCIETFLGKALNLAVLDSGCTKAVCGEEWLKGYLDTFK